MLTTVTCKCGQDWTLGFYTFDDRGDDYERYGWHRVGSDDAGGELVDDDYREVFSWRYNPVANQIAQRVGRARGWARLVHAAATGRPVIAGVRISGARLSTAASQQILVGPDVTIKNCRVTSPVHLVGPRVQFTGNHLGETTSAERRAPLYARAVSSLAGTGDTSLEKEAPR